ncbi:MAG: orotidine-5'-phosphate decarboxylase [Rhodanobacteraceae bacterium]|nr:orotidine-5'-phosphate decarboxylase [Rhodanobacteraceae bacterium]MBL0042399.1 orotidine-5'-phosphate decarboxylase [Xanthomonadales bacterium]
MNFRTQLDTRWRDAQSLLCVGLDPDPKRIPAHLRGQPDAVFRFCAAIVDATADLACAFKPQIAYFHAARAEEQLERLIAHVHERHPGIPVILDAKRGDIGATAEQYAREAFERYRADALTVNPYMGFDSVEPYLAYPDRGLIVLCRTSNPGGSDLQHLELANGRRLYEQVADLVAGAWNRHGQNALVVGATFPEELARVRSLVGDLPLLVPGIGAQGGDIEATIRAGATTTGGLMINSSRAILYASSGEDFAEAARRVALDTRDAIHDARKRAQP